MTENPPGRSESGYWDRCVCGAHRGAHGFPPGLKDEEGWASSETPCKRFRPAPPPGKTSMAGGYYPRIRRKRKATPDRFLEALRSESTLDRLGRGVGAGPRRLL